MSGTTKDAEDVANEAAKAASAKSDEMPSIAVHCAMTLRGSAPRPRSCSWTGRPGIPRGPVTPVQKPNRELRLST